MENLRMTRYLRWRVYAPRENQKKTLPIQKNANFKLAEFSQTYLKQGSTKNMNFGEKLTDGKDTDRYKRGLPEHFSSTLLAPIVRGWP